MAWVNNLGTYSAMGAMDVMLTYRPSESGVHRLNPFVMLSWLFAVLMAAMVLQHPLWLAGVLLSTVPVAAAAGVTAQWRSVMRFVLWMAVAVVLINAVVGTQGSHVLLSAGFRLPLVGTPWLTVESLAFGGAMSVRLAAIISSFTLINLCVHPDDLMRAAIKLRLPYRSVLATSLSFRFIPVLMQDARTIMDVQRSRGLSFSSGGLAQRIRNRGALILPLLSNSLDRAVQVAEAMEARAYGAPVQRTYYRDRRMSPLDRALIVVLWCGTAFVLWLRTAGVGDFTYYPSLSTLSMTSYEWMALLLLLAALVAVPLGGLVARYAHD